MYPFQVKTRNCASDGELGHMVNLFKTAGYYLKSIQNNQNAFRIPMKYSEKKYYQYKCFKILNQYFQLNIVLFIQIVWYNVFYYFFIYISTFFPTVFIAFTLLYNYNNRYYFK